MGDSGNLKHPIYLINQTTATPISPLLKNVLLFNRRGDHDFISDPINLGMEELRTEVHFSNKKRSIFLGKNSLFQHCWFYKICRDARFQKQPQVKGGCSVWEKGPKLFNRSCFPGKSPSHNCHHMTGRVLCVEIQG